MYTTLRQYTGTTDQAFAALLSRRADVENVIRQTPGFAQYDLFRTMVWPLFKESGAPPEKLREVVERLKPLSIASLVQAYEAAMDEAKREGIAARARGTTPLPRS